MKRFIAWVEDWLPSVWATLLIIGITACSVTFCIYAIKSMLRVLGVL